ncbi:hypothetical protein Tco_0279564, partial [Tanacetum coccineum]
MDQKICTLAEHQAENKIKFDDTSRNNQPNNSLSKGIMCHRPILQGLRKRNRAEDLNLCALNANTIMIGSVLLNPPTARGLVIWPETVEASLLLLTTREPKGKIKEFSLALSVELKATSR